MTAPAATWERRAALVLWPLAVGALAHAVVRAATGPARDLAILWRSAASLVDGGPLYDPGREFIYPPLAGWLLAPLGLLPFRAAVVVVVLTSAAAVVAALLLTVRLVGGRAGSAVTAGALLLVASSRPVTGLLGQGNVDLVLLLAEVGVIALLLHRRDAAAGALLGLVCAAKPTLAPVALALVLLGRWRALAAAALTGVVASAAGLLAVPDRAVFWADVLPLLAGGNRDVLDRYDRSLEGAADRFGLPPALALVLRAAALATACWVVWRRRHHPQAPLEAVPLLMLGTLLASSFTWANYGAYLLPLLATVGRPDSLVRRWPAWAGVYLFATRDPWSAEALPRGLAAALGLAPLWGWLLLLGACAAAAARDPSRVPATTTTTAAPSQGGSRAPHDDPHDDPHHDPHHHAQRLGPHHPGRGSPAGGLRRRAGRGGRPRPT